MRKAILGIIISLGLSYSFIFAQAILPDSAEIEVKSPVIQGEATNLAITMMKNDSKMTSYTGTVFIALYNEAGTILQDNEFTLPSQGIYRFTEADLGFREFQKGLEIKKEGKYFIEVSDLIEDTVFGREEIIVQKQNSNQGIHEISFLSPTQNATLISEKVEIIASAPDLPNSSVFIYVDDEIVGNTSTDNIGLINYSIANISKGQHTLKLEIPDIEGNTLGESENINFTYSQNIAKLFKDISINPSTGFRLGDIINVSVSADETVESIKMYLSDRSENDAIILTKESNGLFSKNVFLIATGDISISLDLSAANNSKHEEQKDVISLSVNGIPEIANIKVSTDEYAKTANITRDVINGPVERFIIDYGYEEDKLISSEPITENFLYMTEILYNTPVYLQITPYRNNDQKHGAASKIVQFVLTKPEELKPVCGTSEYECTVGNAINAQGSQEEGYSRTCESEGETIDCMLKAEADPQCGTTEFTCTPGILSDAIETDSTYTWKCNSNNKTIDCLSKRSQSQAAEEIKTPKCKISNITTRTEKIGNNYYLIWDKVENVSKYIVYSSTTSSIKDRVKVYETSDTSYEYPFDHTSEEDQFMYFWIEGICDDGEELELSGATKVQVGPTENFFLLVCLTLLIYFGIKLVRQTED